VRADAQALPLTGSVQVTGQALPNPTMPVMTLGGVVNSVDFASAPALGLPVSIFGSGLADAPNSAGLPPRDDLPERQLRLRLRHRAELRERASARPLDSE